MYFSNFLSNICAWDIFCDILFRMVYGKNMFLLSVWRDREKEKNMPYLSTEQRANKLGGECNGSRVNKSRIVLRKEWETC